MNTHTHHFDLVCIGSGPAGQRAAVQAAKLGKRAAVVEKRRIVGGVCLGTGTIPSKTFREAVFTVTGTTAGNGHGRPRRRPSAEQLLGRVSDVIEREAEVVEDQLARNDVTLIRGSASFKDAHTLTIDDGDARREVTADYFLVAVGTNPAAPPDVPVDGEIIFTSDEICRLPRVPRTLTVVGAGVIGLEYASMFARLGTQVTIIDKRPRPLEFVDWEIVDELMHQMRKFDVRFRLGESVERLRILDGEPGQAAIALESGKHVVSDMVLFSVGRQGATACLNLGAIGVEPDRRGRLSVNECFQTDVPHVYAAGDVIGYPSLAATSGEQGRRAVCHAFDHDASPMKAHFPIGIYAIPEISMVGDPEHVLTEKRIPYEVGLARYREIARGQILGDETGLFKMLFHRDTRDLLGVHAIGTGAGPELIHIGQAVLALGGGLDYFVDTVFNYPTLAECYKVAAFDALNKLQMGLRLAA